MALASAANASFNSGRALFAPKRRALGVGNQRIDVTRTESRLSFRGKRLILGDSVFGSAAGCGLSSGLHGLDIP